MSACRTINFLLSVGLAMSSNFLHRWCLFMFSSKQIFIFSVCLFVCFTPWVYLVLCYLIFKHLKALNNYIFLALISNFVHYGWSNLSCILIFWDLLRLFQRPKIVYFYKCCMCIKKYIFLMALCVCIPTFYIFDKSSTVLIVHIFDICHLFLSVSNITFQEDYAVNI